MSEKSRNHEPILQEYIGSWNVNSDILSPLTVVQDVEWLKSITSLPVLLKGIVTAEDGKSVTALFPIFTAVQRINFVCQC